MRNAQRKIFAVLATTTFAAMSFNADAQTLSLYGRLHVGLDTYEAPGATASGGDFKRRARIFDQNSRVGVRGSEDLRGGLRAIMQIESGANIDSGTNLGQGGQTNVSAGYFGSRDTFVGLEGGAGRLTLGRQSVWWLNGTIMPVASLYAHAEVPWFTGQMGRLSMGIIRNSDTVQYTTPTLGGFNITASWSPNAATGGAPFVNSESQQAGLYTNARVIGITTRWSGGPFAVQVDYGDKWTATNAVPGRRPHNTGWKVLAGWRYAERAQLSAIFIDMTNRDVNATAGFANAGDDLKGRAMGLFLQHPIGPRAQVLAQVGRLGRVSGCTVTNGCNDTASRSYMIGARYVFSPRTSMYLTWNATRNQANQTTDYVSSSITSATPMSAGADPRILALGLVHVF
ncbi:MAG: porin [Burkholderiales bacterium]